MTIPADYQQRPIVSPPLDMKIVDDDGFPTSVMRQFLQQMHAYIVNMTRVIPTNCTNVGNVYNLTVLSPSPLIQRYNDHDIYSFVASATSTGSVTGNVTTNSGALSTLKWYKTNGAAQAGSGDIVSGSLYLAIFNDALDGGAGGLVIK